MFQQVCGNESEKKARFAKVSKLFIFLEAEKKLVKNFAG
jgi:hypothetical protein